MSRGRLLEPIGDNRCRLMTGIHFGYRTRLIACCFIFKRNYMIGFKRIIFFFKDDIWKLSTYSPKRWKNFFILILKIIVLTIQYSSQRKLTVQASALTYYTFFATIPTLAFIFAIARGFGLDSYISDFFISAFSDEENTDNMRVVFSMIESYLHHARGGVFVGIGIIVLLWSVFNVFSQIEKSLNEIWCVTSNRSISRRLTDYFSLTLLIPFLIIISSGISMYINSNLFGTGENIIMSPVANFIIYIKPWLISCLICSLVYTIMPSTEVKLSYSISAGIIAGSSILIFKEIFIECMKLATSYNAVYGSLAAIPVLLMFIRFIWIILLCGAEISFAGQQIDMQSYKKEIDNISPRYAKFVEVYLLSQIIKNNGIDNQKLSFDQLVQKSNLPPRLVMKSLEELIECKLVLRVEYESRLVYVPGCDTSDLSVGQVLSLLDRTGTEDFVEMKDQNMNDIWTIVKEIDEKIEKNNKNILLKSL